MTPTVRRISSRRAASPGRVIARPVVRPSRGREVTHRVRATVSKDNMFANSPGRAERPRRPSKAPLMPDDAATMPHRERLKVFSGSAHPELSNVRAYERPSNASPTPVPAAVRVPASTSSIKRPTRRARKRRRRRAHLDGRAPRAILPGRVRASAPARRIKLFPISPSSSSRSADPFPLSSPPQSESNPQEIANYLGMELGGRVIKKFADGEVYVQIQESIRGCDVFLVQPTCPPCVNDNLMELLLMIDVPPRELPIHHVRHPLLRIRAR